MRVLVCGWRGRSVDFAQDMMWRIRNMARGRNGGGGDGVIVVITGGCSGADGIAEGIARERGWGLEVYLADWEKHGRAAGPIRNAQMIAEGRPDKVLAYVHPASRGTMDLLAKAKRAGIPVKAVQILMEAPGFDAEAE